jgi:hypothetical protein
MKAKYLKTIALLVLAAGIGAVTPQTVFAQSQQGSQGLNGTWLFQVSLQDCNSGTTIGMPFFSLLTFAQDGTMTETTANAMFYPAERGPGHGVWQVYGPRTYKAISMAFITLNGALTRTQTITQVIELLDANSLKTTSASVLFFKPDGTFLGSGCAAATAKRLQLTQ